MLKGDLPLLDSLIAYFVNLRGDMLPEICRKTFYSAPKQKISLIESSTVHHS